MAQLDFPASPTTNQIYNSTNGVQYQWDGAVWITAAGAPLTASPVGPAGGDLQGSYPNPTLNGIGADVVINGAMPSIPNATTTALTFDAAAYNRGGVWSAGAPTRITFGSTGIWLVYAQVLWAVNATGARLLYINNKAGGNVSLTSVPGAAGAAVSENGLRTYPVTDPTDYITVAVWQNSGGPLALDATFRPLMGAWKLAT